MLRLKRDDGEPRRREPIVDVEAQPRGLGFTYRIAMSGDPRENRRDVERAQMPELNPEVQRVEVDTPHARAGRDHPRNDSSRDNMNGSIAVICGAAGVCPPPGACP